MGHGFHRAMLKEGTVHSSGLYTIIKAYTNDLTPNIGTEQLCKRITLEQYQVMPLILASWFRTRQTMVDARYIYSLYGSMRFINQRSHNWGDPPCSEQDSGEDLQAFP